MIGGTVYRGDAVPGLRGHYVFGDWDAGGQLFVATPEGERWPTTTVDAGSIGRVRSFGRAPDGEVFVVEGGRTGSVYRLAPA